VTLTRSDVCELLDPIRAGGDIDVIRRGVELVLQALIDAEATEVPTDTNALRRARTTQWQPWPAVGDEGWRRRVEDPKAARRELLPIDP
jgi:hypothetical protein